MANVLSAINRTLSISLFNRGLAGQIFSEVRRTGAKVVMKNNTAECVLLSPEEYVSLMDEVNDARLTALAMKRLENITDSTLISAETVNSELGISEEDLADADEVELE